MALYTAVGGRESNSFVTLEEADTLVASLPDDPGTEPVSGEGGEPDTPGTGWLGLTEDQKEFCLITAAQAMDYLPWRGLRVYCGQALCFPRTCQDNRGMVPDEFKLCQVFIAHSVIMRAMLARPEIADGEISTSRVTSVSLGGMLSVAFSGDAAQAGTILDRLVKSPQFPAYLLMNRYLTQVRIRVPSPLGTLVTCSTTTTTSSTSSTTTTSTSTTTTAT